MLRVIQYLSNGSCFFSVIQTAMSTACEIRPPEEDCFSSGLHSIPLLVPALPIPWYRSCVVVLVWEWDGGWDTTPAARTQARSQRGVGAQIDICKQGTLTPSLYPPPTTLHASLRLAGDAL